MGAEGTLHVQLLRANGLKAADANGLSDPYAKLSIGATTYRSRTINKSLDPVFRETFTFKGTLARLTQDKIKVQVFDSDNLLTGGLIDDFLGRAEAPLGDHVYFDELRHDFDLCLDTQGTASLQVWWVPRHSTNDSEANKGGGRVAHACHCVACAILPRRLVNKGLCATLCMPVLHPDSRFRSGWNVCLAFLILYCGFAVPLEIAFETDMVESMCRIESDPFGPTQRRDECVDYLLWFWLNFVIDMWFIADIVLNFV